MKLTGALLVLLACRTALLADDGKETPADDPPKLSTHISAMIRAELPGFIPRIEPPSTPLPDTAPVIDRNPDVLELPKLTVRERPPPKIDPLDILLKAGRKKKLARDFKNSFTGLDALLNGFSIPILSPSMAERGRIYHQQQQLEELNRVARAVRLTEPNAAAELQKETGDARRALDQQNQPPGVK